MKTTIVNVTHQDDLYSIQDKLTWNQSGRVLLKLESNHPLFLSRKDLALLERFAKNHGSQLGLISDSRAIRVSAQRNDIPAFKSLREAQQKGWQPSRQKALPIEGEIRAKRIASIQGYQAKREIPAPFLWRLMVFFIAVSAVFSLAFFFLPSAKVSIQTISTTQKATIPINAKTNLQTIDLSGNLPILQKELEIDGTAEISSSGSVEIPQGLSGGDVLLQNLTENKQHIPKGTIFTTTEPMMVRFQSSMDADLPAGVNETIRLAVKALQPGIQGNVTVGSIDAVEGNLGLFVSVSNPEEFTGGENQISPAPSTSDYQRLYSQLRSDLLSQADEQFLAMQEQGLLYVPGSARIVKILDETSEPQIGQPSEILHLSQSVHVEGWFFQEEDLKQVLNSVLDLQLKDAQQALSDGINYQAYGNASIGAEDVRWHFSAEREVIQSIDLPHLRTRLVGMDSTELTSVFAEFGLTPQQVRVEQFPRWWKWMPFLENRIEVRLDE